MNKISDLIADLRTEVQKEMLEKNLNHRLFKEISFKIGNIEHTIEKFLKSKNTAVVEEDEETPQLRIEEALEGVSNY